MSARLAVATFAVSVIAGGVTTTILRLLGT
jgi:hypothetical protein